MSHQPAPTPPECVSATPEPIPSADQLAARIVSLLHHLPPTVVELRNCKECGEPLAMVKQTNGKTVPYTLLLLNHFRNCPARDKVKAAMAARRAEQQRK